MIKKYVVLKALNTTSCALGATSLDQLYLINLTKADAGNDYLIGASDNKENVCSLYKITSVVRALEVCPLRATSSEPNKN